MKSFWFKKKVELYNYSNLLNIDSCSEEEKYKKIKALDYLYFTNNVSESLHKKINNYLPKTKTTPYDFIDSIKNILLENEIKFCEVKRFDYVSRCIIIMIETEKLNEEPKWLKYKELNELS